MKMFFKTLYRYWMKFAKVLGKIQTAIILFFIYFIGVGVISIIAFIFRRDFLDKRLAGKESFWRDRIASTPNLENCKRQF